MALTRKMLKAMGIEDEKIDEIIEAHSETVNALKAERDALKDDAAKLPELQKALEKAQKNSDSNSSWQTKFDELTKEFSSYKETVANKETHNKKALAFNGLLAELGIPEKRRAAITRVSDVDSLELADDGKLKDLENIRKTISAEWSDFIPTTQTQGVSTPNPIQQNPQKSFTREEISKMTPAEINSNWEAIKSSLKNN